MIIGIDVCFAEQDEFVWDGNRDVSLLVELDREWTYEEEMIVFKNLDNCLEPHEAEEKIIDVFAAIGIGAKILKPKTTLLLKGVEPIY